MSNDMLFLLLMLSIAAVFLWAVRRGGPVPRRHRDALLSGAAVNGAGDTSMPVNGGHHGGGGCDGGGHSGGGGGGGGHG